MENKIARIAILIAFLAFSSLVQAQEIWNGNPIVFQKDSLADWTLEENQDRITDNVWITRKNTRGIFNIKIENQFNALDGSPVDTEWSYGTTDQINELTFEPWANAIDSMVPQMLGQDMVVHLITDDIFIDIKFLEWGVTHAGFGYFKYQRATENTMSTEFIQNKRVSLYPNPAREFISIGGLSDPTLITIFSSSGKKVLAQTYRSDKFLDVSSLQPGLYYVQVGDRNVLRLIIN